MTSQPRAVHPQDAHPDKRLLQKQIQGHCPIHSAAASSASPGISHGNSPEKSPFEGEPRQPVHPLAMDMPGVWRALWCCSVCNPPFYHPLPPEVTRLSYEDPLGHAFPQCRAFRGATVAQLCFEFPGMAHVPVSHPNWFLEARMSHIYDSIQAAGLNFLTVVAPHLDGQQFVAAFHPTNVSLRVFSYREGIQQQPPTIRFPNDPELQNEFLNFPCRRLDIQPGRAILVSLVEIPDLLDGIYEEYCLEKCRSAGTSDLRDVTHDQSTSTYRAGPYVCVDGELKQLQVRDVVRKKATRKDEEETAPSVNTSPNIFLRDGQAGGYTGEEWYLPTHKLSADEVETTLRALKAQRADLEREMTVMLEHRKVTNSCQQTNVTPLKVVVHATPKTMPVVKASSTLLTPPAEQLPAANADSVFPGSPDRTTASPTPVKVGCRDSGSPVATIAAPLVRVSVGTHPSTRSPLPSVAAAYERARSLAYAISLFPQLGSATSPAASVVEGAALEVLGGLRVSVDSVRYLRAFGFRQLRAQYAGLRSPLDVFSAWLGQARRLLLNALSQSHDAKKTTATSLDVLAQMTNQAVGCLRAIKAPKDIESGLSKQCTVVVSQIPIRAPTFLLRLLLDQFGVVVAVRPRQLTATEIEPVMGLGGVILNPNIVSVGRQFSEDDGNPWKNLKGRCRKFAMLFVEYSSPSEAQLAIKGLNGKYLDTGGIPLQAGYPKNSKLYTKRDAIHADLRAQWDTAIKAVETITSSIEGLNVVKRAKLPQTPSHKSVCTPFVASAREDVRATGGMSFMIPDGAAHHLKGNRHLALCRVELPDPIVEVNTAVTALSELAAKCSSIPKGKQRTQSTNQVKAVLAHITDCEVRLAKARLLASSSLFEVPKQDPQSIFKYVLDNPVSRSVKATDPVVKRLECAVESVERNSAHTQKGDLHDFSAAALNAAKAAISIASDEIEVSAEQGLKLQEFRSMAHQQMQTFLVVGPTYGRTSADIVEFLTILVALRGCTIPRQLPSTVGELFERAQAASAAASAALVPQLPARGRKMTFDELAMTFNEQSSGRTTLAAGVRQIVREAPGSLQEVAFVAQVAHIITNLSAPSAPFPWDSQQALTAELGATVDLFSSPAPPAPNSVVAMIDSFASVLARCDLTSLSGDLYLEGDTDVDRSIKFGGCHATFRTGLSPIGADRTRLVYRPGGGPSVDALAEWEGLCDAIATPQPATAAYHALSSRLVLVTDAAWDTLNLIRWCAFFRVDALQAILPSRAGKIQVKHLHLRELTVQKLAKLAAAKQEAAFAALPDQPTHLREATTPPATPPPPPHVLHDFEDVAEPSPVPSPQVSCPPGLTPAASANVSQINVPAPLKAVLLRDHSPTLMSKDSHIRDNAIRTAATVRVHESIGLLLNHLLGAQHSHKPSSGSRLGAHSFYQTALKWIPSSALSPLPHPTGDHARSMGWTPLTQREVSHSETALKLTSLAIHEELSKADACFAKLFPAMMAAVAVNNTSQSCNVSVIDSLQTSRLTARIASCNVSSVGQNPNDVSTMVELLVGSGDSDDSSDCPDRRFKQSLRKAISACLQLMKTSDPRHLKYLSGVGGDAAEDFRPMAPKQVSTHINVVGVYMGLLLQTMGTKGDIAPAEDTASEARKQRSKGSATPCGVIQLLTKAVTDLKKLVGDLFHCLWEWLIPSLNANFINGAATYHHHHHSDHPHTRALTLPHNQYLLQFMLETCLMEARECLAQLMFVGCLIEVEMPHIAIELFEFVWELERKFGLMCVTPVGVDAEMTFAEWVRVATGATMGSFNAHPSLLPPMVIRRVNGANPVNADRALETIREATSKISFESKTRRVVFVDAGGPDGLTPCEVGVMGHILLPSSHVLTAAAHTVNTAPPETIASLLLQGRAPVVSQNDFFDPTPEKLSALWARLASVFTNAAS